MDDLLSPWAKRIADVYGHDLRDMTNEQQTARVRPLLLALGADDRDVEQIMVSLRNILRGQARPADSPRKRGAERLLR